jgi:hypothetical protein
MNSRESVFLVRPPPLAGEALSSWRQRSGWANGYRLYPTPDERLRRVDSDLGNQAQVISWLADTHQCDQASVFDLTFQRFLGSVVADIQPRHHPRWWLRARYSASEKNYGPMFCPSCLAEDEEPYFRLDWRLGFLTSCTKHSCLFIDKCPVCSSPPWPSGLSAKGKLAKDFESLAFCWQCGFDLTHSKAHPSHDFVSRKLQSVLEGRLTSLGSFQTSSLDILNSLWAACQIFIRKSSREWLAESGGPWKEVALSLVQDTVHALNVESLSVISRTTLINAAWTLIESGEDSFREFCKSSRLKRFHFNGAEKVQPDWMTSVVDDVLPTRLRGQVGLHEIDTYVEQAISQHGSQPFKYELRDRFGVSFDKWLEVKAAESNRVQEQDFLNFCDRVWETLDRSSTAPRVHKHCTNDIVGILASLISNESLSSVVQKPQDHLVGMLRDVSMTPRIHSKLRALVETVLQRLQAFESLKLLPVEVLHLRQVVRRKNQLLARVNARLPKDHLIFYKYVWISKP